MKQLPLFAAGFAALLPAFASAAASDPALALAPVVVTASRAPQGADRLPVAADVKLRSGSAPATAVRVLALKMTVRWGVQRSA